jgi:transcriptional regulator with XRE-family HTH domain
MSDLATNLREARERLELTQEDVAERSGVHATDVEQDRGWKAPPAGLDGAATGDDQAINRTSNSGTASAPAPPRRARMRLT